MSRPWDALPEPRWELVEPRGNGRAATITPAWDRVLREPGPIVGGLELRLPDALAEGAEPTAAMNSRALSVTETLRIVGDRGRKFSPSDAEYYEPATAEDDEPDTRCETCLFFLPAEPGDAGRCRVVDGTIRRRGVSDFYIPAEADVRASEPPDAGTRALARRAPSLPVAHAAEPPPPITLLLAPEALEVLKRLADQRAPSSVLQVPPDLLAALNQAAALLAALERGIHGLEAALTRLGKPRRTLKRVERDARGEIVRVVEQQDIEE